MVLVLRQNQSRLQSLSCRPCLSRWHLSHSLVTQYIPVPTCTSLKNCHGDEHVDNYLRDSVPRRALTCLPTAFPFSLEMALLDPLLHKRTRHHDFRCRNVNGRGKMTFGLRTRPGNHHTILSSDNTRPRSRGVGPPCVIWHRKVLPSGPWLSGDASTRQCLQQHDQLFPLLPLRHRRCLLPVHRLGCLQLLQIAI